MDIVQIAILQYNIGKIGMILVHKIILLPTLVRHMYENTTKIPPTRMHHWLSTTIRTYQLK